MRFRHSTGLVAPRADITLQRGRIGRLSAVREFASTALVMLLETLLLVLALDLLVPVTPR